MRRPFGLPALADTGCPVALTGYRAGAYAARRVALSFAAKRRRAAVVLASIRVDVAEQPQHVAEERIGCVARGPGKGALPHQVEDGGIGRLAHQGEVLDRILDCGEAHGERRIVHGDLQNGLGEAAAEGESALASPEDLREGRADD